MPRIPTAILITGLILLAGVAFGSGVVLDSVAHGRLEMKRMAHLGYSLSKLEDDLSFLTVSKDRNYAAMASRCSGVNPPSAIFERS